ncbi:MAG: hypothetical protein ACOY4O_09095 [Pseudomonadota bacterium]
MLTDEQIAEQMLALLRAKPKQFSTNPQIRAELKLGDADAELYWAARKILIEKGLVEPARARGGGVKLVKAESSGDIQTPNEKVAELLREQEYYAPVRNALESGFIGEKGYDRSEVVLEICANKRRKGEGAWSVPDLALVACQALQFIPGKILSLYSFEVKTLENVNLLSVYEALAHTRYVNFSYLVVVGEGVDDWIGAASTRNVVDECSRHGIGLIIGDGKSSWNEYEISSDGERFAPDYYRQDQFIARLFDEDAQKKIIRSIR